MAGRRCILPLAAALVVAVVVAVATAPRAAAAKLCLFRDLCSRTRILSGGPGDTVVDACGKEMVFSPSCVARRIAACKIKDPCAGKAAAGEGKGKGKAAPPLIPSAYRGGVVKDGCGAAFRVTPTCKLEKISAACYRGCEVKPIRVGRRVLLGPGTPLKCAARCK